MIGTRTVAGIVAGLALVGLPSFAQLDCAEWAEGAFIRNGADRAVLCARTLARHEPIEAFVASPPTATAPAPFAIYAWTDSPARKTFRKLGGGIGVTALPTPLSSGGPMPVVVWNNTPKARLGAPTHQSPSRLFRIPRGTGRPATFFLQGVIAHRGSAGAKPASVTNGVLDEVR